MASGAPGRRPSRPPWWRALKFLAALALAATAALALTSWLRGLSP
ncbi:MAG: DUF2474 domain-containing protein [Planctomycetota bacterium]|nr:DUF2474 domain-containing protein [Planctomycetota bacterium]